MTNKQKDTITALRERGSSYNDISLATGLSKESVRAFCRYHGITSLQPEPTHLEEREPGTCPNCGAPVKKGVGKRVRRFCSPECRQLWWNTHPEQVQKKAIYHYTCEGCGKSFSAYGNSHRKYCSHACYVFARFRGGDAQ